MKYEVLLLETGDQQTRSLESIFEKWGLLIIKDLSLLVLSQQDTSRVSLSVWINARGWQECSGIRGARQLRSIHGDVLYDMNDILSRKTSLD
jgi:hypothetical protein